ncbi:RagB/SusD family nutrient uptake outer membrane protein [Leeuwenhoekiella marinoflava]|uniref:Starch-binding associating with outer membrane n=2 Tax=Leeuwenhoekiella marinoflava TaxID=988 RepID=A0ABY1HW11_9FLAO|nr:RagB/SusD family nutrient uptake outer membrane protein [Leeuwenhoekiella marinoflava]RXG27410.1 putative outer membrane starch-binding protein [Leeuwenhoekiella marinoflava]SHF69836.1 Starch-binding associating with outer membrane [Leeuwenhoekiella marinoflava DSM 3653]
MKIIPFIKPLALTTLFAVAMVSCTDLEIEETDSIISEDTGEFTFTPLADPESSLNDLFNKVGGDFQTQENMYALSEVTTDELVVPTRGTDWGDNGLWRQLHNHTWNSAHNFIKNSWNTLNQNIYRATEIMESNGSAEITAQAKFLRAYNMFFVMDLFGSVPFRELDEGPDVDPRVLTRAEAFDFIETDLMEAMPDLPTTGPDVTMTVRASQEAANFLLAKMYLNAKVYKGQDAFDNADMQRVIDLVDAIHAKGFEIESNGYFQIFEPTDDTETIFYLRSEVAAKIWNSLHYNQNAPDNTGGGWNGFSTLAEFYDSFEGAPNSNFEGDGQEERRGIVFDNTNANDQNLGIGYGFLIGQQYDADGSRLKNRQGQDLVFTKEIPNLVGNTEATGMRLIKYHPFDPIPDDDSSPLIESFRRHTIFFRYSDAHLMKAEAMMRMGGDPTALVNELRGNRENTPALQSVTETELLAERGRELFIEIWRRNDLIRFDQYTAPWGLKEVTGDPDKNLFPIPETALLSNPNLVQNPGY